METRKSIVAGQFYPGQHDLCVEEINTFFDEGTLPESLPETIVAGIVPHAGWTFSGQPATLVLSAIKRQHEKVNTFVIFGAAHRYFNQTPAVFESGTWITPLGEVVIDEDLAKQLLAAGPAVSDAQAHYSEHSIEVEVPLVQHLFAGAKILPVIVPPTDEAVELGRNVADIIGSSEKKVVCLGSTDLTHYGPSYGFTPAGTGSEALKWASEINDRKFIDLALALEPEGMLAEAAESANACGAGAAAATVAAAKKLGKEKGLLLAHTNSNEVMQQKMGKSSTDSVGYAAIVF
ncbi:MAG: AmmeMemoRadiSam system protein B [Planctomycetota bacterium]|jgi:AmmeMemoRadiSam system protein B